MNYVSFMVKIIEKPEQNFFNSDISVTKILAKLCQIRNEDPEMILQLSVWGNLAYDVIQYYQVNDYIIIEGYISLDEIISNAYDFGTDRQVKISVFKVYPFILDNIQVETSEK